ncbi:MAG TPA: phosphate/phosphite/phosphonate ABC transporter substrate-binding protein [Rhodocyclaceae bacterium]|nr:phosphate/phosphite/phosphonate ABC transporter substrate-binding protein [Rhodocyclaceae bacterium]
MRQLSIALLVFLFSFTVMAQEPLVFAVNEGATYHVTPIETRERFRELADLIGKTLKRPVRIDPVDDYVELRQGLEAKRYDLAFIHPAHHSLRAIRDQKYHLLVLTSGYTEYKARFFVAKGSTLKESKEIKGKPMAMPDPDSITAWIARASMRDLGIDAKKENIQTTRYQDAVPFMVDNGFAQIGISASGAVIKEWEAKGGRVLFASRPVPIKQLIASPNLPAADAERVRELFIGLEKAPGGAAILQKIGFKGFQRGDDAQMAELTAWLGI